MSAAGRRWSQIAERYPGRLDVHFGDALDAHWAKLLHDRSGKVVIVANLPYGVATLLLVGWLESDPWPPWYDRMVLMFQKEVAERIVASPGTKAYGRLAVMAQWRTRAAHRADAAARSLHAAAEGCLGRSRVHAIEGARAALPGEGAGARSRPQPSASGARCCARA